MNNIINFPTSTERRWSDFEGWVLGLVREAGVRDAVAAEIATNIRPLFDIIYAPVSVEITLDATCFGALEEQKHLFTDAVEKRDKAIIRERIEREIQACKDAGLIV